MEEVLGKLNQLENIILNVKDELEQKIEELRQENQMQHQEFDKRIETIRQENQVQHEGIHAKIGDLREENQMQHQEFDERIETIRQENQVQHEGIYEKIKNFREENQSQHEEMCLQIYGKMILEHTKLEGKIKQELQNQFAIERAKNVERIKRLNDLDSRIEKTEVDVMLCQDEISELKGSMV